MSEEDWRIKTGEILDCTVINGKRVLLDGHGKPLPEGAPPVWLKFKVYGQPQRNSAGQVFAPQVRYR